MANDLILERRLIFSWFYCILSCFLQHHLLRSCTTSISTAADKVFDDQWSWKKTRGIESWEVSQGTFIRSETRGARNTGDTARKAASKREIVHRLRWMDEAERIDVWSVFYNPIILVDLSGFPWKLRHGCAVKSSVVINGKTAAPIVFRFLEWSADGRILTETTRWIAYRR